MKDYYQYPAIFNIDDDISIFFPDLHGCLSCADDMQEAFKNAKEALQLHLFGMEEDGEEIPQPSSPLDIKPEKNQVLVMIEAWMPPFREKMMNKSIKKTVTILRWINLLAEKENVDYSHLLQMALRKYLGMDKNNTYHFKQV